MRTKRGKKGIILAGGKGTRFHPITLEIPKPLITVKKKPLINYSVDGFAGHGVTDVKVIIKPEDREDYQRWLKVYEDDFLLKGVTVEVAEEPEPMGTAGFIAHYLRNWMGDEDVFVVNSDDIKDVDFTGMHEFHKGKGAHATVAIFDVGRPPEDYGSVALQGHTITAFLEKRKDAPSSIINVGAYILSPQAFGYIRPLLIEGRKYIMFEKDLFPAMAAKGVLAGFKHKGIFRDCGTLEKWQKMIQEA